MIDILKRGLLAGIGATVTTKERVEAALDEFVAKGKLSAEEAKAATDKIIAEGKEDFENQRNAWDEFTAELIKQANFATQDVIRSLEEKMEALEAKLKEPEPAAAE